MGKYINDKTYPALVLATHWNYIDLVKLLLENGADLKEKDKDGKEAIQLLKESAKEIEDMIAKYNKRQQKIKRK